jgi:iron complex transport system ATP-binding protein
VLLEVEKLGFGFPGRRVGHDFSFSASNGQILSVLGPNGSGKTTLFRTLLRFLPALEGQILIDGEPVSRWSRSRFARAVAYVPQAHAAVFPFTVLDFVLMGRTAHLGPFERPSARDAERARSVLHELGIGELSSREITRISGGERQLATLARALVQEAGILVLDEPASSLDFGNQHRLLEEIRLLARKGLTILMSTHAPNHALELNGDVLLIKGGRLVARGKASETITATSLKELYGIDVEILEGPGGRRACIPAWEFRD